MSNISQSLDKAFNSSLGGRDFSRVSCNGVLIYTLPGTGAIAECRAWAKNAGVNLIMINAADADVTQRIDKAVEAAEHNDNTVVLFSEYDRANFKARPAMLSTVSEAGFSNNILFCIAVVGPDSDLNTAERSKFNFVVRNIPDTHKTEESLKEAIAVESDLLLKLTPLAENDIFDFMKNLRGGTYFNMGMYSSIPVSRAYKKSFRIYKVINMTAIVSGVSYENIGTTKDFRDRTGEGPGKSWYDHVPGFENKVGARKSDPNIKYVLWDIKEGSSNWVRYYLVDIDNDVVTPVTKEDIKKSPYLTDSEKAKLEPKKVEGYDKTTGALIQNQTNWRTAAFDHIFWLSQAGKECGTRFVESKASTGKGSLTEAMEPDCETLRNALIDKYTTAGFTDDADLLSGYSFKKLPEVVVAIDANKDTVYINPELALPENLDLAAATVRHELGYIILGYAFGHAPTDNAVQKVSGRLTPEEQSLVSSFTLGGVDYVLNAGAEYNLSEALTEDQKELFRDAHATVDTDLDAILSGGVEESLTEAPTELFRDAHAGVDTDLDAILAGEVTEDFDDETKKRFNEVRYDEMAFIDITGSGAQQKALEDAARKDGFAGQLFYEADSLFKNVLKASDDVGDNGMITLYTADNDHEYNCPELASRANVEIKLINNRLKESYRRTTSRGSSLVNNELFVDFD